MVEQAQGYTFNQCVKETDRVRKDRVASHQGAADRLKHTRDENRRGSILHTITKRR